MSGSVRAVWTHLSAAVPMEAYGCLTCGAWSTVPSYMSLQIRVNKVRLSMSEPPRNYELIIR